MVIDARVFFQSIRLYRRFFRLKKKNNTQNRSQRYSINLNIDKVIDQSKKGIDNQEFELEIKTHRKNILKTFHFCFQKTIH